MTPSGSANASKICPLAGHLPAVEDPQGVVLTSDRLGSDGEAALGLIEELKRVGPDLDQRLTSHERAQVVAFAALIQQQLEPATLYTTWAEKESYWKHTRVSAHLLHAHVKKPGSHKAASDSKGQNGMSWGWWVESVLTCAVHVLIMKSTWSGNWLALHSAGWKPSRVRMGFWTR